MSNIFFFTDVDLLNEQTPEQAFGPVVGYEETQYRVTSIHSAHVSSSELKDMPRAIAVLKGRVVIQRNNDDTGNELVNLALYPDEQISQCDTDSKNAPKISYSPIKCILYKGLKRESILADAQTIQKESEYGSDLLRRLWANIEMNDDARAKANLANNEAVPPSSNNLGYEDGGDDSNDMDGLFYKEDYDINPPISVEAGMVLGCFAPEKFGIEIIFESVRYTPKLSLLRHLETIITVPQTEQASADERRKKDEVINFIDPCAFYGSLYRTKIKYKNHDDTTGEVSGNDIYSQLLGKFHNKNKIYIDIRNEYNQSFNYLRNYESDIIHLNMGNAHDEYDYYQKCHWPILIQDMKCPSDAIFMKISLELPYDKAENPNPLLYVVQGFVYDKRNPFPYEPEDSDKFIQIQSNKKEQDYTKSFTICVPVVDGDSMSSYIRLKYLNGNSDEDLMEGIQANSPTNSRNTFWDNMIMPLQMKIPYKVSGKTMVKVYDEEYFISAGKEFVASLGVAEDENNIMYFAVPKVYRGKRRFSLEHTSKANIIGGIYKDSFIKILQKELKNPIKYGYITKSLEQLNINYPYFAKETLYENIFILILNKENLQSIINNYPLTEDVYLKIQFVNNEFDDNFFSYNKYKIGLSLQQNKKRKSGTKSDADILNSQTQMYVYGNSLNNNVLTDGSLMPEENSSTDNDCKELSQEELQRLRNFIENLGKCSTGAFRDLYDNVFNKDKDAYISVKEENGISVLELRNIENINKGYLIESCTMYTMWLYACYLDNDMILKETAKVILFPLLKTILINYNGLGHGLVYDGELNSILPNIKRIFFSRCNRGVSIGSTNGLSYKLNQLVNGEMGLSYNKGTKDNIVCITDLINAIQNVIRQLIQQKSNCIFLQILKQSNLTLEDTSFQYITMAIGDGSGTKALLNITDFGIILFDYAIEQANVKSINNRTFQAKNKSTTVHFTIFGLDAEKSDTYFSIEKNDIVCVFKINAGLKKPEVGTIIKPNKKNAFYNPETNVFEYPEGNRIAYYNEDLHELVYDYSSSHENIVVELYSPKDKDIDEACLVLNVFQSSNTSPIIVVPFLHEYFDDDKFELKTSIIHNLFGKNVADLQSTTDTKDSKNIDLLIDYIINSIDSPKITMNLSAGFIGKEIETPNICSSLIETDYRYKFTYPYHERKKEENKPNPDETNLVSKYAALRYSFIKITFTSSELSFYVESYVSPVRSRLDLGIDKAFYDAEHHEISPEKRAELKNGLFNITRYGCYNDDSYVLLENGDKIPSYNAILCAFRSFGITEAVLKYIYQRAFVLGKSANEIKIIKDKLTPLLEESVIKHDLNLGRPIDITFEMYTNYKTYTQDENELYQ